MNWITLERTVRNQALRIFTPRDLQQLLGVSPLSERFLVHRYMKRGALLKLRNGLYALADQPPSDFVIANRLYEPSYISLEYALAYYHLIPEMVYAITSVTPRPTRTLTAAGKSFEYHRIKQRAFTGYEPTRIGTDLVLIATPEKALVDYLYLVDLRKTPLNDRLSLRSLIRNRLISYATLFERPSLMTLVRRLK